MAAPKCNKHRPQLYCDHGNRVRESIAGFAVITRTEKGQGEREQSGEWKNNVAEDFFHSQN